MSGRSKFQEALTVQQVLNRMLPELANAKPNYVAQVGGSYPPPNAFINQTPEDKIFNNPCGGCLVLRASVNEVRHKLNVYEGNSTNGPLVFTTNWLEEPAKDVCYTTDRTKKADFALDLNKTYKAVLFVASPDQTQVSYEYIFTSPPNRVCSQELPPDEALTIAPNPTGGGTVVISFENGITQELTIGCQYHDQRHTYTI
jgi:hypothetical protein